MITYEIPDFGTYLHSSDIDSTSLAAQRLIREGGCQLPFAVGADMQHCGRGRRGRSWSSPAGNLYLSLALNPADAGSERGILPVRVACLLCLWMRDLFGLRLTIKWPNDLCYGTKKLAGILCESSWQGGNWGPVVIGIGMNVRKAPEEVLMERAIVSLNQILKSDQNPRDLAGSLLSFWWHYWDSLNPARIRECYQEHAPGPGQFWFLSGTSAESGELPSESVFSDLAEEKELLEDGGLCLDVLTPVGSVCRQISVYSVCHGWSWVSQKFQGLPVLFGLQEAETKFLLLFRNRFELRPFLLEELQVALGPCSVALESLLREASPSLSLWPVFCPDGALFDGERTLSSGADCFLICRSLLLRPFRSCWPQSFWQTAGSRDLALAEGWMHQGTGDGAVLAYPDVRSSASPSSSVTAMRTLVIRKDGQILDLRIWPDGLGYEGNVADFFASYLEQLMEEGTDAGTFVTLLTCADLSSIPVAFGQAEKSEADLYLRGLRILAFGGLTDDD